MGAPPPVGWRRKEQILVRGEKIYRYEKVAADLARLIDQGTFRPGDRVPSLRGISRRMQVSISTALEAYRLLEDRQLIEARPQSGYYVRRLSNYGLKEPKPIRPEKSPTTVSVDELVQMVIRDSRNRNLVPLGAAVPNPDNLPVDKLNRLLAAVARRKGVQSISYEMANGCEALRVQIARRLLAAGCSAHPQELVITSGCQEAVALSLMAVCRPGDTVAIESPTYFNHLQTLEVLHLKALEIPSHPASGISFAALETALKKHRIGACLLIPNFSNPLGSLMPDEQKQALAELIVRHDLPLIEDDIYGDLGFAPERPPVVKAFDKKGLVILCSSFSKTLAPGYRIGWIHPGRFQAEIERLKTACTIATATAPQLAVAEFLNNGGYDHHLRKIRRIYMGQIWSMTQAVSKFFPPGTRVTRPAGGFVLWVELPEYVDSLKLYELALQAGITIAPGPIFSIRRGYRNYIRLNAAFWSEKIEKALALLGHLAENLK
ncbi:MAG: PLP-dependent aminotransferase family protein [Deltaproteobacteria bacterium]|nr:PLP-dependent aminotransferase family protein [Deltaproteobacteria bacterium]